VLIKSDSLNPIDSDLISISRLNNYILETKAANGADIAA
jgi:hypothetical protein